MNLTTLTLTELLSEHADAEYALTFLTPGDRDYARAEGRLTDILAELHRRAVQEVRCAA